LAIPIRILAVDRVSRFANEQIINAEAMTTNLESTLSTPALTVRLRLTDGSVHLFRQENPTINAQLCESIEPLRLFAHQRIVIGSEHSKSVFVSSEIIRVDFLHESFDCWEFPAGFADIVELSQEEFRKHSHLDQPALMAKREQSTPPGDLLVSFVRLHMRGGQPLFVMIEIAAGLPAERESFLKFMLSKGSIQMRLRGGGTGVVNLANLVGYTVYPGLAQIPADSWLAEPVFPQARRVAGVPV
jgi:hypothetical protein